MTQRALLYWLHFATGVLVAILAATGAALYWRPFTGAGAALTFWLRDVHKGAAVSLLLLLVVSLPPALRHLRHLARWPGKRVNLWLFLALVATWAVSGVVMWLPAGVGEAGRSTAAWVHDVVTLVGVPWAVLHSVLRGLGLRVPLPTAWYSTRPVTMPGYRLTRRDLLWSLAAGATGLAGGSLARWFWPGLDPARLGDLATAGAVPGRKGYFRFYTVTPDIPRFAPAEWRLTVAGLVARPAAFSLHDLERLPQTKLTANFHCVTGWSVTNVHWQGVRLADLLAQLAVAPEARFITFYSGDGEYTDTLTLEQAAEPGTLLATMLDNQPLPQRQGWPCRLVVTDMYGYKSVKWVTHLEFTRERAVGYWQGFGYPADAYIQGRQGANA